MLDVMPKKPPPPGAPPGLVQSNVRMPQPALDYLDEWAARLNREAGWAKHTRSDLIRDLVLDAIERDKATIRASGAMVAADLHAARDADRVVELTEEEAARRDAEKAR